MGAEIPPAPNFASAPLGRSAYVIFTRSCVRTSHRPFRTLAVYEAPGRKACYDERVLRDTGRSSGPLKPSTFGSEYREIRPDQGSN